MIDELEQTDAPEPHRPRHRTLRATAALPSLATLGNGVSGFAAIHFATRPLTPALIAQGPMAIEAFVHHNLVIAAWLVFLGMVWDALDGRLARMTRQTSDFGGQLDSLCDAISFGVAPAILMLRAVQGVLFPDVGEVDIEGGAPLLGKTIWVIAAVYVCCTVLRLARFNVENDADESSHMGFKGLPSPAAALAVVSLVLLHESLAVGDWDVPAWLARAVVWAMPVVTALAAVLMISRVPYVHAVNRYLRSRQPIGRILLVAAGIIAAIIYLGFQRTLAVVAVAYLLSGPTRWAWVVLRARRRRA